MTDDWATRREWRLTLTLLLLDHGLFSLLSMLLNVRVMSSTLKDLLVASVSGSGLRLALLLIAGSGDEGGGEQSGDEDELRTMKHDGCFGS